MTTLTVELPQPLARQIESSGMSKPQLENIVVQLIEAYLSESEQLKAQAPASRIVWTDSALFARRVISNNHALFEALAHL